MRKILIVSLMLASIAGTALAVSPGTDVFLASVGRLQGSCPGGVCALYRTDAWIYNPSTTQPATVGITFLARQNSNVTSTPTVQYRQVAPGETLALPDIFDTVYGLDNVAGALRFTSDQAIVVTGRIYDANVQTNKGTGTAGQFFPGIPAELAISAGASTNLIGLTQDAAATFRANFGFVETTGNSATIIVDKRDASGALLASKTYTIGGYGAQQVNITDVGGPLGSDQRLTLNVTQGPGRIIAFASQIDNATGDPYTIDMVTPLGSANTVGRFDGVVFSSDDSTVVDGGIEAKVSLGSLDSYSATASIPCGTDVYTLETDSIGSPVVINADGSFTSQVAYNYGDGTTTFFTVTWTLSGTLTNGVLSGTLVSDTTGGSGSYAACNVMGVSRVVRAGWTGAQ